MKVVIISILAIISMSLSDILYCNEKKDISERAPLYRSKTMLGLLTIFRIIQVPLVIYLGILNWKVLIGVIVLSIVGMRTIIDRFVEKIIIVPFSKLLLFLLNIR